MLENLSTMLHLTPVWLSHAIQLVPIFVELVQACSPTLQQSGSADICALQSWRLFPASNSQVLYASLHFLLLQAAAMPLQHQVPWKPSLQSHVTPT